MSDPQPKPDKSLSEISHLFLSSVRERQTQGNARPQRRPPAQQHPTQDQAGASSSDAVRGGEMEIDLTPEEFAQVLGGPEPETTDAPHVPLAALLAGHLGASQIDRAREFAAHHASGGARVGLIELDAGEFRLWLFEPSSRLDVAGPVHPVGVGGDALDARRMGEALNELAHDVDQWFVLLPSPRSNEARSLLRELDRWVLLTSSDHDGIVAGYRTLKGLAESHGRNDAGAALPRLSLAVLDARDPAEASRVFAKLAAVCQQFLHWPVEPEPAVARATGVAEHLVLSCRSTRDKAQLAAAPQWQVVQDFLRHLKTMPRENEPTNDATTVDPTTESVHRAPPSDSDQPGVRTVAKDFIAQRSGPSLHAGPERSAGPDRAPERSAVGADVIDLPSGETSPASIVAAVLRGGGDLIECPIHPPMCPHARLAVSRDRRLVLVAVARQGLCDLRAIGQAYRWLIENRPLISLAVPQFAIDAHQLPRLHLLVDHADMSAEILQPMLQSANVTVHAYRKLRWGGKTGLLLEAA